VLHSFSSSTVLTRLRQKMTMNAMFVLIFCSSYETRVEDNNKHASSSFSIFFLTLQKTMMNLPTHHCLLQLKKKKKKTQKPIRRQRAFWLVIVS
jgi:hypothetical protein